MAFACDYMKAIGKRYEGKPHVPFDEGVVEIESWQTYTGTKLETTDTDKECLKPLRHCPTLPVAIRIITNIVIVHALS